MATRVTLPMITRKKKVPSKHDPNTFRVVCYNEDSNEKKYPDLSPVLRAQHPLGICANERPNILSYCTKVLPSSLFDYRANRPYNKKCGFLTHNYHMLNEPVPYIETDGQPQGHWIAPTLLQEELPQPPYRPDTISRKDFSGLVSACLHADKKIKEDNKRKSCGLCAACDDAKCIGWVGIKRVKPDKLKAPWEIAGELREKISYEHNIDCRKKKNPIRGKRVGSFTWKTIPKKITNENQQEQNNQSII